MSRSDRWSARVESVAGATLSDKGRRANKANDFSRYTRGGSRLSARRLAGLADELTERDRELLFALARLRVASGSQLERLSFRTIADSARGRVRRRVLGRLVELGLVVALDRRVGGARAGSAGLVYALSGAGWRLVDHLLRSGDIPRRRTRATPGALFLVHALAIAEVYVDVVELARGVGVEVSGFDVEADAVWRDGGEEVLRPDALVVLSSGDVEDVWWLEVDRSTEALGRIHRLLDRYRRFADEAETGPHGVIPRVLVTVVDDKRRTDVERLIGRMRAPQGLLQVVLQGEAGRYLIRELVGEDAVLVHEREPPER